MYKNYFSKNINGILINNNKKIIIDWSAKSACTNIVIMFFKFIDLYEEFEKNNIIEIHFEREKYNKENIISKDHLLYNDYLKIKFVRNPYDRIVSSYIHSMKYLIKKDISFMEFLILLNENKLPYNIHYFPQFHDLEVKYKIYHEIIKIEEIFNKIENLNYKYNINLCYSNILNHSIKKNYSETNFVGNIKFSNLKNIPKYKYFYNKDIKNLVSKLFYNDLRLYNYTFEEFLNNQ